MFEDHGLDHGAVADAEEAGEGEIDGYTLDGVTRTPDGMHFFLQGLQISMKDDGRIFVHGTQTDFSKPIFLSSEHAITLDNVSASTLQLTAPQIFSAGESSIDSLTLEGLVSHSTFSNTGVLTTKELFLKNLKSGNIGTITAPRFSVEGELESTGTLESDECILEESTFLRLVDGSRASIKTLFLSPNSFTENQITDEISIDVLDGLGGTLTNLGELTVGEVAAGATFQSILNRKIMAVMAGTVNTHNFENNGRWAAKSPLIAYEGKNTGTLIASDLQVGSLFTNAESGVVVTAIVSGAGALENLGKLGNVDNLAIGIRELTNNGSIKAKSITGSVTLKKLVNKLEKTIDATEDLSFTSSTQVINDGALVAKDMHLVGEKTTQRGVLSGTSLAVSGVGEFENLGEIAVTGAISLNLPKVINRGSVEAASITGSDSLTHLENSLDASIELQGGSLKTLSRTTVVNRGLITGGNYEFAGPKFSQRGTLEGISLTLSGAGEFENRSNTEISGLVTLGGSKFINRERLKAREIKGLEALTHLENSFGAEIILQGAKLRTEALTTVINDGLIIGGAYEFNGPGLLQRGTLKGSDLVILGRFEFENLGEIELSGLMTLDVLQFINSASIKARAITGTKRLTNFENTRDSSISLTGGTLTIANHTSVANHGTITGGAYDFAGPSLIQWGVLRGKSLKLAIDTEISTSDSQDLDISDSIDTFNILTPFVLRGTTKTARFSHIGVLELYGTLSVAESFNGSGTIAPSGKLYAGAVECEEDMKVLGEVETETIAAVKALAVNGKVKSKRSASVGGKLSVGAGGKVQGIIGEEFVLDLRGGAEIAGTVDTDSLTAAKAVMVADKGQLLTQQSTTLIEGLAVAKGAIAQLRKLKVDGGAISNAGGLSVIGVEKGRVEINLSNEGVASIDGLNPILVSVLGPLPVEVDSLKMRLLNKPGGQLTLKSGKYDLTGERALLNQGALIQEQASVQWSAPKLLQRINVGEWHISSVAILRNYSGESMGDVSVNATLFVWSQVDAIRALDGLKGVKALKDSKVVVYAPVLHNTKTGLLREKRSYIWPLKLVIASNIDNAMDIRAPKLEIESEAGYLKTSGYLYSDEGILDIGAKEEMAIDAKIGGQAGVKLRSKRLKVSGRLDILGAAYPDILYRRSGNGIYSQGHVDLNVVGEIDNSFGVIHGESFAIVARQLVNRAGYIKALDPRILSYIIADIKNIREDQGSHTARVNGIEYTSDGKDWCSHGTRPFYCTCDGTKQESHTYETSNEGLIIAQGSLQLIYDKLDMIASRIACGGDLTLKAGGRDITHSRKGAVNRFLGITTAEPRNGHYNFVLVKERFQADLGDADMTCAFTARDISIRAVQAVFRNLGVQTGQRGVLLNLSALIRGPDAENVYEEVDGTVHLDLPFKNLPMPKSVVVLGKGAHKKTKDAESIDVQATIGALHHAMGSEFFTLYRGVRALGIRMEDIAASFAEMVRGHKDTRSHRRAIKAGEETKEVEVLSNEVITPEYLMKSEIVGVFFDFTRNIHRFEDERQAQVDAREIEREAAGMFTASAHLALPDTAKHDGHTALDGDVSEVVEGDNSVFTNVKAKKIKLVSTRGVMTFGSTLVRHGDGDNYHDELVQSTAIAEETIEIRGAKAVHLPAAKTKSKGRTDIVAESGPVIEEALAAVSQRVDRQVTKKSITTTTTIDIHHHVASHESVDSIVNISGATGIYLEGTTLVNAVLTAPVIENAAVNDQHIVRSETVSRKRNSWFSTAARKSASSSSVASIAKGCTMSGQSFIAIATERYRAVAPTYDAPSHITAPKIEIATGVNRSQSHAQSTSQGMVWTKTRISSESHTTHVNPRFESNVYLHSPEVIIERVRGTADFTHVISDSPVAYLDKVDQHQSTSKTQKNLSAGMQLLIKGMMGVGMMFATPLAGAFNLVGVQATMVNAGFATLCGDAAVNLVEQGGNPAKAISAMGKNGTALNIARAMGTAGLIGSLSGAAPSEMQFLDYAKQAALQSAVNTVMSVAIDGQDFKQAMLQGMTCAAINAVASYGAGKIGDARSADRGADRVGAATHKALHFGLGAGTGAISAAITGGDVGLSAVSSGTGAVVGHTLAETVADMGVEARVAAQIGNVGAIGLTLAAGMDPVSAALASNNATEHNFLVHQGDRMYLEDLGIMEEGELALGEGDCPPSPSIHLREALEVYSQEIDKEQTLRDRSDLSLAERAASRYREWNMRCALGDASEVLSHRDMQKATIRLAEGTSTAEDRKLLLLGAGQIAASAYSGGKAKAAAARGAGKRATGMVAAGSGKPASSTAPRSALKVGGAKPDPAAAPSLESLAAKHGAKAPRRAVRFADESAAKSTRGSEQPWTVRDDQEWKHKVFGKAQVTGGSDVVAGEAHAFRSYREAIAAAKRDDVSAVFLNQGICKITGLPIAAPNTRPDVTIRRSDGIIDQVEVRSRTDDRRLLEARMQATQSRLPVEMQGGTTRVVEFTRELP